MPIPDITHTFFDFEIEQDGAVHLVKVLSVDGRRFTYEVHGDLSEDAVTYVKSLIDAVVFSDLIIERTNEGFDAREVTGRRLKKHS